MSGITLSIFLGLLGMIPMGLANAMAKIPTQKIGSTSLLFFRNIFTIIFLTPFLLFNLDNTKFIPGQIILALALSIIVYIAMVYFYKGLSIGKVAIVSPIASSYVILSLLLSVLLLGAVISKVQILSIIIIILGIIISSLNFNEIKRFKFNKNNSGLSYALVTMTLWGIFFFFAQIPNKALGPYLTSLLFEIGMFACAIFHLHSSAQKVKTPSWSNLKSIVVISGLTVVSVIAFYLGLAIANPALILVLNSATPIVIVLYGALAYKEKLSPHQYLSVCSIILGIVLIALS